PRGTAAWTRIGRARGVRWAEEGAKFVVLDVYRAAGEKTASLIKKNGGECLVLNADVSKENDAKQIADQAASAFGKIDILVNNAAVFVFKGLDATVDE